MKLILDRMPQPGKLGRVVIWAAVCLVGFLPGTVLASEPQVFNKVIPVAAKGLPALSNLDPAKRLNISLSLPWRNQAELDNFIQDLSNPSSPNYRHYLTTEQFTERFGPTVADYQALMGFAKANGFDITARHPNRAVLSVSATVAQIQTAFHVTMKLYQHPYESRDFYCPDAAPIANSPVPLLHISGLTDYYLPKSRIANKSLVNANKVTPMAGSGPGGSYMGGDFRAAYIPNTSLTGSGQSVGLVQFDGYLASDITQYALTAGVPQIPLVNVYIDGSTGAPGFGNVEVCLDIETVMSMAPGLTQIYVYMAPNPSPWVDILSRMANDNLSRQLSCSWGGGPPDPAGDQIFLQMASQGQSFFNASGDSDAFTGFIPFPAESPYITQVGGTTLTTTGPLGSYVSETVWNWGGGVGSCGGISPTYSIPVWQQGISMTAANGSTIKRNIPDVALTADNVFVVADGGIQYSVGGTSAATPLWAAFTSLVNQQGSIYGRPPVGFINPAIYSLGKGNSLIYSNAMHDITTGDNTSPSSPNLFFAVTNYDLCTGMGTPSGSNLVNYLAPTIPQPYLVTLTNVVLGGNGNGQVDPNECNSIYVTVGNIGALGATNIVATLTTTTPGTIVTVKQSGYPDLPPGASGTNGIAFQLNTAPNFVCGTPIVLALVLKCNQGSFSNSVVLSSGIPGAPIRYDNYNPLAIPDANLNGTNSTVLVSNINSAIKKVTVSFYTTHTFDSDLSFQLISPGGVTNNLIANRGANGFNFGVSCSPDSQRTTLDDAAVLTIAAASPPFVGSFIPERPLSVYAGTGGTNVNGVWTLHIVDDLALDVGTLQCWSLFLTPAQCSDGGGECPGADLAIGLTAVPEPVTIGNNLIYNISVTNNGPRTARNVSVSQVLPASTIFVSATPSQGGASQSGGVVTCGLGALGPGEKATVTVVVLPTLAGTISSSATVTSEQTDYDLSNNTATAVSHVNPPTADLIIGLKAAPSPTVVGATLTYSINVTNNGPSSASGVTVSNVLPAGVAYIGTTVSQGSASYGSGVVLCSFGGLPAGGSASATIQVIPTIEGTLVDTATASAIQLDPVTGNNSATVAVVVGPAADLLVTMTDNPDPVVVASNYTYSITVSNLGPSIATGVVMNHQLPDNITLVSSNTSQGSFSLNGNTLSCAIGSMNPGTRVTIGVVVANTNLGTFGSSATVTGTELDPNLANNTASVTTTVANRFAAIAAAGVTLTAESYVPPNGAIDIGETVTINFRLRNIGNITLTNVTASLQPGNGVAPIPPTNQTYGVLAVSGFPVGKSFSFVASGTNGGTVIATLHIKEGPNDLTNLSFSFPLPVLATYTSTNAITIRDNTNGLPYPSVINVSGLTGIVSKVTATLSNFAHTYPPDVDALVTGPVGQSSILMSGAGGNFPVSNATLTFDDAASNSVPESTQIFDGSYKPADYTGVDLPPSAPVGPYNAAMAALTGSGPNGAWSLYIADHAAGDVGVISNGWSLALTLIAPVNQVADLALSGISSPNPVVAGDYLTYTFSVTNNGPNLANVVGFTNALPSSVILVSAACSQGVVFTNGNSVSANLGSIASGSVATISVVVQVGAAAAGTLFNTAMVSANETDVNPLNNQTTVATTVTLPYAELAVSQLAAPSPVFVGSNLTYTLTVTNRGPGAALDVVLTNPLPAGVVVTWTNTTQGTFANVAGKVICQIGGLASNATATVTLLAVPSLAGQLTNIAYVATASQDTNTVNNSASTVVPVIGPSPVIVAAGAALTFESGPVNGAVDPTETVTLNLSLQNTGTANTTNLTATLLATGGVTSPTGPKNYGVLVGGGGAVARSFGFTASGVYGGIVTATLQLQDGANNLGTVTFTFNLPVVSGMANANAISIPDHGPGSIYPLVINVSGLSGIVSKAVVNLNGLTHSFPHDVNVLLVSPAGNNVLLMSHAGAGYSVTNVNLTFDDTVGALLPLTSKLTNGTYHAGAYTPAVAFPGPAPTGPFGADLSSVKWINPNGNWSLYVFDDTIGDAGNLNGGWTLTLTTVTTVNPIVDLAAGLISTPVSVILGGTVTNTITITNNGPNSATSVIVNQTLPAGVGIVSVVPSQGSYTGVSGGLIGCNLGTLSAGANASVKIVTLPSASGGVLFTASASCNEEELNTTNNTAQYSINVIEPGRPRLSGSISNHQFHLTVLGQAGVTYVIQGSTNATSWTSLSTNAAAGDGSVHYTDPTPGLRLRYYRTTN